MMDPMDLKAKEKKINLVLSEPRVNLWKLRELALTEGGLVNDTLRRRAWPKLVGLNEFFDQQPPHKSSAKAPTGGNAPPRPPRARSAFTPVNSSASNIMEQQQHHDDDAASAVSSSSLTTGKKTAPPSLDSDQIDRDVARCTWHLLTGTQRMRRMQMNNKHRRKVATLLRKKQRRLGSLINLTLLRTYEDNDEPQKLRYYQGYHDVASIFMSTLSGGGSASAMADPDSVNAIATSMGLGLPAAVLSQLSTTHFRDAMQTNFMQLQTAIRLVLMPLISYFDPQVHDFLIQVDMEPFFALSWIITWFSHDIRDTDLVKRLFDAFIVSHPLLPLYVAVAMVCHTNNRHEVLNAEPDFAVVHNLLSNLPKNSSMVGWRYRPSGEGYASGDEGPDEDGGSQMSALDVSMFVVDMEGRHSDDEASMVSSTVSGGFCKAPFQEIIDMALDFMRSVPPRKILNLTKHYYADEALKPMLHLAPEIVLLQPHVGLQSSVAADWVLKQRARQMDGRRGRKRRDRSTSSTRSNNSTLEDDDDDDVDKKEAEELALFLKTKTNNLAVIACGYGPGDADGMAAKRRRRRIIAASVAVAVLAVFMASSFLSSSKSSSTCNAPSPLPNHDISKANDFVAATATRQKGEEKLTGAVGARGHTKKESTISPRRTVKSMELNMLMKEKRVVPSVIEEEAAAMMEDRPLPLMMKAAGANNKAESVVASVKRLESAATATLKRSDPVKQSSGFPAMMEAQMRSSSLVMIEPSTIEISRGDEQFVATSLEVMDKVTTSMEATYQVVSNTVTHVRRVVQLYLQQFLVSKVQKVKEWMTVVSATVRDSESLAAMDQFGRQGLAAMDQFGRQSLAAMDQFGRQSLAAMDQFGRQSLTAMDQMSRQSLTALNQLSRQSLSALNQLSRQSLAALNQFGRDRVKQVKRWIDTSSRTIKTKVVPAVDQFGRTSAKHVKQLSHSSVAHVKQLPSQIQTILSENPHLERIVVMPESSRKLLKATGERIASKLNAEE